MNIARIKIEHDLLQLGRFKARSMLSHICPERTMVIMDPMEADSFGQGFVEELGIDVVDWMVIWQERVGFPSANGDGAITRHSYRSSVNKSPAQACILSAFNDSASLLRGKIYQALDNDIALDQCFIVSPWMTSEALERIDSDFGFSFQRHGVALVSEDKFSDIERSCFHNLRFDRDGSIPRFIKARLK